MTQAIEAKIEQLPEALQQEVLDYIEFLLQKYQAISNEKRSFRFDWEGALSDVKDRFSSIELQHQSLEWRACI